MNTDIQSPKFSVFSFQENNSGRTSLSKLMLKFVLIREIRVKAPKIPVVPTGLCTSQTQTGNRIRVEN